MEDITLAQDNRITTSRYELTLMEKRIMYVLIRDIRNKYVLKKTGERNLFDDLIIKTTRKALLKDLKETNQDKVKKAFKSLRLRSFEWSNGLPINDPNHEWFEVGWINYGEWKHGGNIEFQVSHKILPFFVELTKSFTEYSLLVAISLKSKWSQRMYELCCKWRVAGGFTINVKELRKQFVLEDKYGKYGALRKFVLDVAHKELKALYNKGQCDVHFEYNELKNGRSVEQLKFKVISKENGESLSNEDIDYIVRTDLHKIFDTKNKPKNKAFVGQTMTCLRLDLEKMNHCYKRLKTNVKKLEKEERARYMRFIINEDYLKNE